MRSRKIHIDLDNTLILYNAGSGNGNEILGLGGPRIALAFPVGDRRFLL